MQKCFACRCASAQMRNLRSRPFVPRTNPKFLLGLRWASIYSWFGSPPGPIDEN